MCLAFGVRVSGFLGNSPGSRLRGGGTSIQWNNYSALKKKKNDILPFVATWTALEGIPLSEVSPVEQDKYRMSLTCGI